MYRFQEKPKDKSPHPIWRGFGCILVVVILMMSYATADLLIQENFHQGWVVLPPYLNLPLSIPSVSIPSVGTTPAINISNLFVNLVVTIVLALLLFTIISIVYSIVYRASGGGRPGPMDAAPIKRRGKQRKLRRE
ncbi:MAG: hypothetical protein MUO64_09120 [Anaerolineales bacterium]|nr:hypothetical protein [Anaerolineales bacterium]